MNECCCISDGYDGVDVYHRIERKARKEHKCYECGDIIPKGKLYERISACDGTWTNMNLCKICRAIIDDFLCGFHPFGGVYEEFCECMGFYPDEIPDYDEGEE